MSLALREKVYETVGAPHIAAHLAGRLMLSWLFGPQGRVPDGDIVYAVGDIHGRDDLLGQLHEIIVADIARCAGARRPVVVYLGDYVDRGPASRAVVDRLLEQPVEGALCVHLKGNHEDAMLRFLDARKDGVSWFTIGGGATARSYGVSLDAGRRDAAATEVIRAKLLSAIPSRHLAFLRSLQLTYEAGDYLFVHAGIRPGRPLGEQQERDLLWIRGEFLKSRRRHEKVVVHGHSSRHKVVVRRNRICVDTAAYATDRLTCVVLEGKSCRFLSAEL